MMNMILILFFSALLSSTCHASNVNDFCIADLKGPDSPSGYECLPPNTLTADNFVFSLQHANTSNPIKAAVSSAFVTDFPAVNGLGVSAVRIIMDRDGFFPLHTHRGASELLYVVKGRVTAGLMTPTAAYYKKTLKPGDLMVFPQGLFHFVANSGKRKATVFAAFSSSNPGVDLFGDIFSNNIPSKILAKTSLLDVHEVKKLKACFGGSG